MDAKRVSEIVTWLNKYTRKGDEDITVPFLPPDDWFENQPEERDLVRAIQWQARRIKHLEHDIARARKLIVENNKETK